MQRLIDDLLAYSRAGTPEYRIGPVDCEELVRDTLGGHADDRRRVRRDVIVGDLPDRARRRGPAAPAVPEPDRQRDQVPGRASRRASRCRPSARSGALALHASPTTASASTRATPSASSRVFKRLHSARQVPGQRRRPVDLQADRRAPPRAHLGRAERARAAARFCFTIPDRRTERRTDRPDGGRCPIAPARRISTTNRAPGKRTHAPEEWNQWDSECYRRATCRSRPKAFDAARDRSPYARDVPLNANGIDGTVEILLVEDNPADARLTREVFEGGRLSTHLNVVSDGEQALAFLRREGIYADRRRGRSSCCSTSTCPARTAARCSRS